MPRKTKSGYIKSSELSEYIFCSVAWYLKRQGYGLEDGLLEEGHRKHIKLGETIDRISISRKISLYLGVMGIFLILIAGLLFLLEGIL